MSSALDVWPWNKGQGVGSSSVRYFSQWSLREGITAWKERDLGGKGTTICVCLVWKEKLPWREWVILRFSLWFEHILGLSLLLFAPFYLCVRYYSSILNWQILWYSMDEREHKRFFKKAKHCSLEAIIARAGTSWSRLKYQQQTSMFLCSKVFENNSMFDTPAKNENASSVF